MPVSVHDGTTDGWSVTLRAGVSVSGVVHIDGGGPLPRQLNVRLDPVGAPIADRIFAGASAAVSGETFRLPGVRPGEYVVRVDSRGAPLTLRMAARGSEDVADRPLRVGTDDISDIEVFLTSPATAITGVVGDDRNAPLPGAVVVAIPADRGNWIDLGAMQFGGLVSRRLVRTQTKLDGTYGFTGLPAGEYVLAAFTDLRVGDWPSRALLESVARSGTRVTLADGDTRVGPVRVEAMTEPCGRVGARLRPAHHRRVPRSRVVAGRSVRRRDRHGRRRRESSRRSRARRPENHGRSMGADHGLARRWIVRVHGRAGQVLHARGALARASSTAISASRSSVVQGRRSSFTTAIASRRLCASTVWA